MHIQVDPRLGKEIKTLLEQNGIKPRIQSSPSVLNITFPGTTAELPEWATVCPGCDLCSTEVAPVQSPKKNYKYSVYPPMVLLATGSVITESEARELAADLGCTHVAVNEVIQTDRVRRPQIRPIVGDFGTFDESEVPSPQTLNAAFWATARQNGISQSWAPLYTMFSRGNITEKKRVLDTFKTQAPIKDTTVIDIYCGIGYFTFSYMANQPRRIYCWEINPWSVEGIVRGAKLNRWPIRVIQRNESFTPSAADGIVVFLEDNKHALERLHQQDFELGPVSHINMGLLPDCRPAWSIAKQLATASTIVHVHENVRTVELDEWTQEVQEFFGPVIHVEKIKPYSPGVLHICGDFHASK